MTKEKLDQDQEEENSSPGDGSESEESSDDLFEDEQEEKEDEESDDESDDESNDKSDDESKESEESDSEGESEDESSKKIEELAKTVKSLEKGFKKAFSKKGKEGESVNTSGDDLETLFFEQRPEAEHVSDDLKSVAEAKGISILKAWREEKWLQEKANKIAEEKKVEEESKSKIGNPTSRAGKKTDFSKLTEKEVEKLSNDDKVKYFDAMYDKEKKGVK